MMGVFRLLESLFVIGVPHRFKGDSVHSWLCMFILFCGRHCLERLGHCFYDVAMIAQHRALTKDRRFRGV
jgi:hypothetical protein